MPCKDALCIHHVRKHSYVWSEVAPGAYNVLLPSAHAVASSLLLDRLVLEFAHVVRQCTCTMPFMHAQVRHPSCFLNRLCMASLYSLDTCEGHSDRLGKQRGSTIVVALAHAASLMIGLDFKVTAII